jgi:hypothetical protein
MIATSARRFTCRAVALLLYQVCAHEVGGKMLCTHPRWHRLANKLVAQIVGKVVAVSLKKMVAVALVLLAQLLDQPLYFRWCERCFAYAYAFAK